MKTKIHSYWFETSNPSDLQAYNELRSQLVAQNLKCFCTHGGNSHFNASYDNKEVELDSTHLFENQWNTMPGQLDSDGGVRVFDWAEDYPINFRESLKRGHYLEQTEEMVQARKNRLACGYCGHQLKKEEATDEFCMHCLGSVYLKETDLLLLRLLPVSSKGKRKALSQEEETRLLAAYYEAQLRGLGSHPSHAKRLQDNIAKLSVKANNLLAASEMEVKVGGFILAHCPGMADNYLYYDHSDTRVFGWQSPLSKTLAEKLRCLLTERGFPAPYTIKETEK